jgi:hypothetical protein
MSSSSSSSSSSPPPPPLPLPVQVCTDRTLRTAIALYTELLLRVC